MNMSYTSNESGTRFYGHVDYSDIKQMVHDMDIVTVKSLKGTLHIERSLVRLHYSRLYRKSFYTYTIGDVTEYTDKFSDIAKILATFKGHMVSIEFGNNLEVVITNDDDFKAKDDCCYTYDTEEWVDRDDAYYCESDGYWYASDDDLAYIDGEYYRTDDDDVFWCEHCEEYHRGDATEVHTSWRHTETWCEDCVDNHAFQCDDCGEWWSDDERYCIDRPDSVVCSSCYEDNYYYCEECGRTVHYDYWDSDEECCDECSSGGDYVKKYHWHHYHDYTNKNRLFMPKGEIIRLGNYKGTDTCGLELEVVKEGTDKRNDTIDSLNELVEENEIFYEHDGSLDAGGSGSFEIITGIHTFNSLKNMKWKEMLKVLTDNGYQSHNGNYCGLHIHVGRKYFGESEEAQNLNIGKIYGFYNLYWREIVKVSRRQRFTYCDNPYDELEPETLRAELSENVTVGRDRLRRKASSKQGSHGVALNNSNDNTFEFRLGRGTLLYESFMAWIDFTLTIAKNARHISFRKVCDADEWLKGISKDTARYIQSKGAFADSKVIKELVA